MTKKPKKIYIMWNDWDATFALYSTEKKAWKAFAKLVQQHPGGRTDWNPVEVREVDSE